MSNKQDDMYEAIELLHKKFPDMPFALLVYSDDRSIVRTTIAYENLSAEDILLMIHAASSLTSKLAICLGEATKRKSVPDTDAPNEGLTHADV